MGMVKEDSEDRMEEGQSEVEQDTAELESLSNSNDFSFHSTYDGDFRLVL